MIKIKLDQPPDTYVFDNANAIALSSSGWLDFHLTSGRTAQVTNLSWRPKAWGLSWRQKVMEEKAGTDGVGKPHPRQNRQELSSKVYCRKSNRQQIIHAVHILPITVCCQECDSWKLGRGKAKWHILFSIILSTPYRVHTWNICPQPLGPTRLAMSDKWRRSW